MNTKNVHLISNLFIITLFAAYCTASCVNPTSLTTVLDYWPAQTWRSSSPEAQGMDSAILAQMFETIEQEDIRLHSLLIVRDGYLVVEAYWHPYSPDEKHTIESNTKSIIGSLVGIAMDQGSLKSVDQKMVDFFSKRTIQNLDSRRDRSLCTTCFR